MNPDDKQRNYELAEKMFSEQNFTAAVIAGAVATILAAALYGITTSLWSFSYGFAVTGIGVIVGISMQYLGRGISMKFAVAASIYTLAGCALGDVFRLVMNQVRAHSISPLDVIRRDDFSVLSEVSVSLGHLFFWFVAVWFAVFLVKRPLSRADKLAIGMHELKD